VSGELVLERSWIPEDTKGVIESTAAMDKPIRVTAQYRRFFCIAPILQRTETLIKRSSDDKRAILAPLRFQNPISLCFPGLRRIEDCHR
jgi:hypothetical protein